jgi:hypothetical protein
MCLVVRAQRLLGETGVLAPFPRGAENPGSSPPRAFTEMRLWPLDYELVADQGRLLRLSGRSPPSATSTLKTWGSAPVEPTPNHTCDSLPS